MVRQLFIPAFCSLIFYSCSVFNHKQKVPEKKAALVASAGLQGTWILDYVLGPADVMELYPDKKPEITISEIAGSTFQGSSGCNRISGKIRADDRKMTFTDPVALTRLMCPGAGDSTFFAALKRVNRYGLNPESKELTCVRGDIVIMRFHKK